jgi:hypothetical protein
MLAAHGALVSEALLPTMLMEKLITSAPTGLATKIAPIALSKTAATGTAGAIVYGVTRQMMLAKAKTIALFAAAFIVGVVLVGILVNHWFKQIDAHRKPPGEMPKIVIRQVTG